MWTLTSTEKLYKSLGRLLLVLALASLLVLPVLAENEGLPTDTPGGEVTQTEETPPETMPEEGNSGEAPETPPAGDDIDSSQPGADAGSAEESSSPVSVPSVPDSSGMSGGGGGHESTPSREEPVPEESLPEESGQGSSAPEVSTDSAQEEYQVVMVLMVSVLAGCFAGFLLIRGL